MKAFSRDLTALGLLINALVLIGFVVLVVKAFTPGPKTPPRQAIAAVAAAESDADAVVTPTAAPPTATAPSPTVAPTAVATTVAATTVVTETTVATETTTTEDTTTASEAIASETTDSETTTSEVAAPDASSEPVASEAVVAIVIKGTCNACHVIPGVAGAVGIVGPNLANIGVEAGERIPGYSAEEYLRESLVDPNAFIAPKCPFGSCTPGGMPNTLAQTLTPEEIQLMIDYLLMLQTPQ